MSNQVVWNGKSILVNKISSKTTEEAMVKKANEFGLVKGIITIGKKGKEWSAKIDFDNHEQAVKGLNALNHLNMEGGSELNAQPFLEGTAKEQVKGNNLVIKGFSEEVNSKELQSAFETFGQIFSLVLMKPQKIGYVQFFSASDKANILQKQDASGGKLELHCGNRLEKIVLEEFYEKKDQGNTHRYSSNQQNSRQNQQNNQNAEYNSSYGQPQNDNTIVIFGKNYSEVPVAEEQIGQFQRSIEQGLRNVVEIVRQELSDLQLEYFVQYNLENKNFWSHLFGNGSKQVFARVLEIANRELRQSFPACSLSFKKDIRSEQVPTAARLICFGIRENVSIKQIHQWLESTAEKAGISSENVRCKLVHKKSKHGQNHQNKNNDDGEDDDYDEEGNLNQSYSSVSNSGEDRSSGSSHSQKQYLDTESQVLYISFPSEEEGELFLKKCSEISILPESIFNKPKIVPLLPESQRNSLKKHQQHMRNYNNNNSNRPHHNHNNYSNNTSHHNNNNNNYSHNSSNYHNNANFNNNSRKNAPTNYNNSNNNQQSNNYQNNNNNTSYQNHNSSHQYQQQQNHYSQNPNQQGRNRNQNNQQSYDGQGYNNGNSSAQQFQQPQYQNNGKYKYVQTGYNNNNNNQHYNRNNNNNNQQYNDNQNANYQPQNRQNQRQLNNNNNNNGNNTYQNSNNNNQTYSGRQVQQANHNEQINSNYNKGQPKHNQQQVSYQSKNQVQNGKNQTSQYQGQQGVVQQQQSINQQNNRQSDNVVISTTSIQSNQLNAAQTNVNSNNTNNSAISFQQLLQDTLKNSQNKQNAEILRKEVISRKREFIQIEDKSMKEQIIQAVIKSLITNLKESPETVAKILKLSSTAEAQKSVESYVNLIDSMCPLFANAFPVEEVIQIMEQQDKLILKCDFFVKFKNS